MDNYFDPVASPNLGQDDPLRTWAAQLQSDPDLPKLMATDPQAAIEKMKALGLPPPPGDLMSYTDGLAKENSPSANLGGANPPLPTQSIGGATPPPPPTAAIPEPPSRILREGSIADRLYRAWNDGPPPVIGPNGKMMGNLTSSQGVPPVAPGAVEPQIPLPASDPRRLAALDPVIDSEINPNPSSGIPLPVPRPKEAGVGASDLSARKKIDETGDALGGFSKSLQGVKPVAPPPPNYVGTPSVRAHGNISAPNLQSLLSLVGQPGPSPLGLTLGRLLATGKA